MTILPRIITTKFLPAERFSPVEVRLQAQRVLEVSPLLQSLLDTVPDVLLVLNAARQVIVANRRMRELDGQADIPVLGLRPGEILDCRNAASELGCGTTEACRECGAMAAFLSSRMTGQPAVEEFRVSRRRNGDALDLRVQATPLQLGADEFTIFVMTDISDAKRRRALEHIFFHDVLNTVTAMRASADIIGRLHPDDLDGLQSLTAMQSRLVDRLIEEIVAQRQLLEAENDELSILPAPVDVGRLMNEIAGDFGRSDIGRGRTIIVNTSPDGLSLVSDAVLLRRVLANMAKNALEASRPGETVALTCSAGNEGVEFCVHNPAVMPASIQVQVFQRSFSTKGAGRGLGTYSMKLLTERYLSGRVSFTSTAEKGTTFRVWLPYRLMPR